jgi:hypothetical protein
MVHPARVCILDYYTIGAPRTYGLKAVIDLLESSSRA